MDLTEAEDIKKRWQEYTEELYKKDLHDPDDHDGVSPEGQPARCQRSVVGAISAPRLPSTTMSRHGPRRTTGELRSQPCRA